MASQTRELVKLGVCPTCRTSLYSVQIHRENDDIQTLVCLECGEGWEDF